LADPKLNALLGDALFAVVDWALPKFGRTSRRVIDEVIEAVRPNPPMTIRTLDGYTVTGMLVADRGQVLVFVGTRVPMQQPRYYDDEPALWRDDPFRR
jgi:hypothetical protein